MAERNGFIVHEESYKSFDRLSDERLGKLFRAMYKYASGEDAKSFPDDEVLDIIFETVRDRMDRDALRYDETCKARSEAGKKGGRPKKANGFSEKAKKANGLFEKQTKAKKAYRECDSECECERDPDPVPECECECERECDARAAQVETQHTAHSTQQISLPEIIDLATQFGYEWDMEEARSFLAYNIDKGRTKDWGFAVQKWEENRSQRKSRKSGKSGASGKKQEKMQGYLSTVNRFKEAKHGSET